MNERDLEVSSRGGETWHGIHTGKLTWGLVLIAIGSLILLDRFTGIEIASIRFVWPLIPVVIGVVTFATARGRGGRRSGLWLVAVGFYLLASVQGWYGLEWHNSWPLVVMAAGVIELIYPKRGESRYEGLWPLGIGIWLAANVWGIGGMDWSTSWPLVIILIGALMVGKALLAPRRRARAAAEQASREAEGTDSKEGDSHGF